MVRAFFEEPLREGLIDVLDQGKLNGKIILGGWRLRSVQSGPVLPELPNVSRIAPSHTADDGALPRRSKEETELQPGSGCAGLLLVRTNCRPVPNGCRSAGRRAYFFELKSVNCPLQTGKSLENQR